MQIKTAVRNDYGTAKVNSAATQCRWRRGTLDGWVAAGGSVKSTAAGKGGSQRLVELNTQPPYDPAVVLLGAYPRKIKTLSIMIKN